MPVPQHKLSCTVYETQEEAVYTVIKSLLFLILLCKCGHHPTYRHYEIRDLNLGIIFTEITCIPGVDLHAIAAYFSGTVYVYEARRD